GSLESVPPIVDPCDLGGLLLPTAPVADGQTTAQDRESCEGKTDRQGHFGRAVTGAVPQVQPVALRDLERRREELGVAEPAALRQDGEDADDAVVRGLAAC